MGEVPRIIRELVAGAPGAVSLLARDLGGGTTIAVDSDRRVPAASTIKVPILGAVAAAVRQGRLIWEDTHTLSAEALAAPGSGVLLHMRPPVQLTLYNLATLMIIVSDNAATNYLITLVGFDAINAFCADYGLESTVCQRPMRGTGALPGEPDNWTTMIDQARLYERLYRGEVVDAGTSRTMLDILGSQQLKGKMARYLNGMGDLRLAHKTGSVKGGGGSALDAGLIIAPGRAPIVFAAACVGWRVQGEAEETIARLAQAVVGVLTPPEGEGPSRPAGRRRAR